MNINYSEIKSSEYIDKISILKNKIEQYREGYAQYKQQSYNETQVRVDFVNFLFQLLGWDVLNEAGLPQHLREVTHEASNQLIVCPNHHSIIHDTNPVFDRRRLIYIYKNGLEQKLALNRNL